MRYKPYPKYKESGVAWLGEVPEGWRMSKLKFDSYIKARVGWHGLKSDELSEKGDAFVVTGSDFFQDTVDWKNCRKCSLERYNQDKYIQLRDNDLLVTKDGTIGKVIKVKKLPQIATLNSGVFVIRPLSGSYLSEYYYWVLISSIFHGFILYYKTGSTILHLYQATFEQMPYPLPSLDEQKAIANYLDQKTQKIDTLIEKQQTLIKLLKEKRQALISHAVTKGLDDTVKMKDSGVAWLGEVPESWEVKQVKYLLNNNIGIKIGPFGSALKLDDMVKKGYKVYGQENVIKSNFSLGKRFISNQKFNSMIVYKVEPNDILITMMGTIGKCIVVPKNIEVGIIDSHLIKIRTNELISSEYFSLMIDKSEVVKTQLELNSKGSIMQGLNSTIIKALIFPLPPIDEQYKILNYLDQKTKQIDTLISKSTQAIELLKERRSALISAVVTGKVDVRNDDRGEENEL